ncbi:MAG: c-type cytochrome [Gallionellaceae bacterium]|jgi:thiosulfate dehydrogenase
MNPFIKKLIVILLLSGAGNVLAATSSNLNDQSQLAKAPSTKDQVYFKPPAEATLPNNAFGELVRRGEAYFVNTKALAPQYVGNELNCVNCHLDRGRMANSAPLWAAYSMYPAYRKKNNKVNTFAERMQGCFKFSMNGVVPAADSEVLVALTAYSYWLSSGVPIAREQPGRGYAEPAQPAGGYNVENGKKVFESRCVTCHGADGAGQKVGASYVFPPLWGKDSFNWGAGMHRINTAAGFIKHSMPLGEGNSLSDKEAWDVAAYVNMHERPQDPRLINGDIEQTRKKFHAEDGVNLYGVIVNGVLIGQGTK